MDNVDTVIAQLKEENRLLKLQALNLNAYIEKNNSELAERGFLPDELQMLWRDPACRRKDPQELYLAIVDALVHQGGIAAWVGDGVGCVAQMVQVQIERAEKAEAENKILTDCVEAVTDFFKDLLTPELMADAHLKDKMMAFWADLKARLIPS